VKHPTLFRPLAERLGQPQTISGQILKDFLTLIGQNDVANLSFAKANCECTTIVVKTFAFKTGQLGVAVARQQGRLDQLPKVGRTYTDQPPAFNDADIA
jgi:hypothetical protein